MSEMERARRYAKQVIAQTRGSEPNDLIILARQFLWLDAENNNRKPRTAVGWGEPFGAGPPDMPRGGW